jgi:hypothetical protein
MMTCSLLRMRAGGVGNCGMTVADLLGAGEVNAAFGGSENLRNFDGFVDGPWVPTGP